MRVEADLRLEANLKLHQSTRSRIVAEQLLRRNPRPAGGFSHAAIETANHRDGRSIKRSPPLGRQSNRSFDLFVVSVVSRCGAGIEPVTARLSVWCSTFELTANDSVRSKPMFGTAEAKLFQVPRPPLDRRHHCLLRKARVPKVDALLKKRFTS